MFHREETERAPAISVGLASTLSGLLRQAVEDAQAVEKMEGYALKMQWWHKPEVDGTCSVCMAGAVMVRRLGADKNKASCPENHVEACGKLVAIDYLRIGRADKAAMCVFGTMSADEEAACDRYSALILPTILPALGRAPWDTYLAGADLLEAAGL